LTRSKDWDVPDGAIMRCTANSQPDIGSDTTLYAKPAYLLMSECLTTVTVFTLKHNLE